MRLLGLVRALVDYGRQLASTLQQRNPATDLTNVVRHFGTIDIGQILARITRGLHRAAALEARLASRPAQQPNASPAPNAPSRRQPRAAKPVGRSAGATDKNLARLPTPGDIAAEIRSRPVGAVIADICREFGIVPSHKLWRELSLAIIENGGSLATLFKDILKRVGVWLSNPPAPVHQAGSAFYPPSATARGTGPP